MIFLEVVSRAVEEVLLMKFENAKLGSVSQVLVYLPFTRSLKYEKFYTVLADFDETVYRLHTLPNIRSKLKLSIWLTYSEDIQDIDASEFLRKEYGSFLCTGSEDDATVSLLFDLDNLPDDYVGLARQASLLKRNCFEAILHRYVDFHRLDEQAVGVKRGVIQYRPDETLYLQASADRITVVFSTVFRDPNDLILSRVFLQELVELRRRIDRAPQVFYSQGCSPAELMGTNAVVGDNVAYVTFVLFPRHLLPAALPRTINLIFSFRNYLHYHLKCSEGYIHRRMRSKTTEFMKILNRAQPQAFAIPLVQVGTDPISNRFASMTSSSDLPISGDDEDDETGNGIECAKGDDKCTNNFSKESTPDFPPPPPDSVLLNGHS